MTTDDRSLLFDTIELYRGETVAEDYWFEVLADGAAWGDPQQIEVIVASLLRDGALTETESNGNRTAQFQIKVCATDPVGLSQGVEALHRATRKRTTLRWQDGDYPATVLDVETSALREPGGFDDLAYNRNETVYVLSLTCLPFARGEFLQTTEATAVPSVGDVVNDADATTGWSATAPGGVSLDTVTFYEGTGSVAVTPYTGPATGGGADVYTYETTLTQAIDVDAGGYLSFVVRHDGTAVSYFTASNDPYTGEPRQGQIVSEVREFTITSTEAGEEWYRYDDPGYFTYEHRMQDFIIQALPGGWKRYTLRLAEGRTISSLKWKGFEVVPTGAASPTTRFDQVAVAESATLGSQVLKTISVGGSARTTGSLHIASPSDAVGLGQVVAFTIAADRVRSGFRPDLRQWDDGTASTTIDADATNGSYYDSIGTSEDYLTVAPSLLVPAEMFNSTAHTMVARIKDSGTGDVTVGVRAQLVVDGVEVGEPLTVERTYETWGTGLYRMIPLGSLYLPPLPIAGATSDAIVRFRLRGSTDPEWDELYAFPVDGDLSIIDCGAGTAGPAISSHLWIDSPSQTQPQGGYWRGETGDRVNAVSAWSAANVPGTHSFDPGDVLVFAASTGTLGPTVNLSNYERFLFHATR